MYFLEITCGIPPNGTFTEVVPPMPIMFEQTFTYSCISGYKTTDDLTVSCMIDGQFSAAAPTCSGKC
jgi:hypothetical protein